MRYSINVGFGWGRLGPGTSGIRAEARRLGVELQPFPFANIKELVTVVPVVACGDDAKVREFADRMAFFGYGRGDFSGED